MSDYLDTLNALLPEGMRFEWVAAEPVAEPSEVDAAAVAEFEAVLKRQIAEAFGSSGSDMFPPSRSAFSPEYRHRQRARVKRRRR